MTHIIDPCARAEVLAEAVMDTLKAERKNVANWDDFDMAASSIMTIMAVHGGSEATQPLIARVLRREFIRRKDSASSPLLPHAPLAAERSPLPVAASPGGGQDYEETR
jgi:hypothetical protein